MKASASWVYCLALLWRLAPKLGVTVVSLRPLQQTSSFPVGFVLLRGKRLTGSNLRCPD